jgi:hypothetical protein
MIITPGQSYFVESAQKYSAAAAATDYLLYTAEDVRSDITRSCGDTLEQQVNAGAKRMMTSATSGATPAVFSPLKVVELATESDLEYTNALGGASQANSDILSIMNSINAIYERDIGLTFTVTYQHAWTTADPFGTNPSSAATVLTNFTNNWNQNPPAPSHDVSHLWTGKRLTDANGVAWQGVVCANPTHAYGISDRETISPFRVTIPAHELGHNFNASHADSGTGHPECDNTIMVTIRIRTTPAFSVRSQ